MRYFFLLFFLILGCSKPTTMLICGDHECINKKEAKLYFEENFSLEVRVIDKNVKKTYDLIELNLEDDSSKKQIAITEKKISNFKIKKLSKEEKIKKRNEINLKTKQAKLKQKKNNKIIKKEIENLNSNKKIVKKNSTISKKDTNKKNKLLDKRKKNKITNHKLNDVCLILDKCDIDEITNYLIKKGNEKKFPDISKKDI